MTVKEGAKKPSGAIELFGKSYRLLRSNLNLFAVLYFIPLAMVIAEALLVLDSEETTRWNWWKVFSGIGSAPGKDLGLPSYLAGGRLFLYLVLILATIIVSMLLIIAVLRVAQGHKPSLSDIWQEFVSQWLWLRLLGLQILAGVMLIAGFILLIIPGLILLWRLFLAPYILIDKNTSVTEAIKQSWDMTRGYAWAIYSVLLVGIALGIPSVIPFVGEFIAFGLGAIYMIAPALRYQELKKLKQV